MKYLAPWLGFFIGFMGLIIPPIMMLPLCLFIRWDNEPTTGGDGGEYSRTIRGDLPGIWGKIFATPDERFPGGLNEPTVVKWLARYGKVWTSYLWAGTRNRFMGLSMMFSVPATEYIPDVDRYENGMIWRTRRRLGKITISYGWQVYGNVGPAKELRAVPLFTGRWGSN